MLSEKQTFVTNFPFFNRFTQTPNPLNGQNLLSMTKVFCQCSLTFLQSVWEFAKLHAIHVSMVYVPMCANFSFLHANVPINVPTC